MLAILGVVSILCTSALSPAALAQSEQQTLRAPNNMFPQWSWDGKQIAFTSDRDGDPEIYIMNADGSHQRRLTYAPGRDAHPFFSRDSKRIIFQSPRDDGHTNIYIMNADGTDQRPLTFLKGFAGVPVYSPDETQIAFMWRMSSDFDNIAFKWLFGSMNADGSRLHILTDGKANDQVPNWTRDGKRLLFFSDRSGKNQLYTMRVDGTDVRLVVKTPHDDVAGLWSPDSRRIVFTSDRDGNREVYVMGANGKNVVRLTNTPAPEQGAVWSPDGRRIAFSTERDGNAEIYVMDPDGSNLMRLTGKSNMGAIHSFSALDLGTAG
jgi:Tol biopolymer transport system component